MGRVEENGTLHTREARGFFKRYRAAIKSVEAQKANIGLANNACRSMRLNSHRARAEHLAKEGRNTLRDINTDL